MDLPTKDPAIRISELGGVNERVSRDQIPPGQWDILEGMFPARNGMLERIPGRLKLASFGSRILAIHPTLDGSGNILIQTEEGLQSTTLDALYDRVYTPSITFPDSNTEDNMSMAVIIQRESNGVTGGSPRGILSGGTDAATAQNTFYGRRLTHMLVNESSTVQSFTASTGGTAGAVSTAGQFVLSPGTYRFSATLCHNVRDFTNADAQVQAGLYNTTKARFEYHNASGGVGTEPITSTTAFEDHPAATTDPFTLHIQETSLYIAPADGNQTYEIRHAYWGSYSGAVTTHSFCGGFNTGFTVSVNGSAIQPVYAYIVIKKVS